LSCHWSPERGDHHLPFCCPLVWFNPAAGNHAIDSCMLTGEWGGEMDTKGKLMG